MHKGIRNYRPTPTQTGTVCEPSIRRSSVPNTPGGSQRNSPTRSHSPTRAMLHHLTAPGVASYALDSVAQQQRSVSRSNARNQDPASYSSHSRREQPHVSPTASRRRGGAGAAAVGASALSSLNTITAAENGGGFDYDFEVKKLMAKPVQTPVPAPCGAPSFVIVAATSSAEDAAGVPVTLAANFDQARAAASAVWRVPLSKIEEDDAATSSATPQKQVSAKSQNGALSSSKRTPTFKRF